MMLLSSFLYNIGVAEGWIGYVITLPFLIFGLLFFIDYFLFGILKKIKWKPFGYVFNIIDKFYKYITFIFIYDTLYYAFISNVKRRIIFLLIVGFIFFLTSFESFELEEPTYFPNVTSSKNKVMLGKKNRKITRALLVSEVANYDFGICDSRELFEALIIYTRVFSSYLDSIYTLNVSVAELEKLTDSIYTRN
jgi:hypothetical protein